jgi:hypothetical protein
MDHVFESVPETPSPGLHGSPSSRLPPSSQPLEPVSSSPPLGLSGSTPRSSSLVLTPPKVPQSVSNVWDNDYDFYDKSPFRENSQDPLLLATQLSPKIAGAVLDMLGAPPSPNMSLYSNESEPRSRRSLVSSTYGTPVSSPAPTRSQSPIPERSQSVDPLSLFNTSSPQPGPGLPDVIFAPTPNVDQVVPSPQQPFTPHLSGSSPRPPLIHPSLSLPQPSSPHLPSFPPQSPTDHLPLSPLIPPSTSRAVNDHDPLLDSTASNVLPVLVASPFQVSPTEYNNNPIAQPMVHDQDLANIPDLPRYSLRRRGANQLKPYTIEKLQYKKALSSNPDAIVKFRSPGRGGQRYSREDDVGESQEQWEPYAADDDEPWEKSQHPHSIGNQAGPSRIPAPTTRVEDTRPPAQYSEFLQDLPTTDEEEAKELNALSKEARKAARERKAREARAAREAKEKTKGKKVKSFPLSRGNISADKPSTRTGSNTGAIDVRLPSPLCVAVNNCCHICRAILRPTHILHILQRGTQIDPRHPSSPPTSLQTYSQTMSITFVHFHRWSYLIKGGTPQRRASTLMVVSWIPWNLQWMLGTTKATMDELKAMGIKVTTLSAQLVKMMH